MRNLPDGARGKLYGTIKVIGIGQSLREDDAAGLKAVRLWQKKYLSTRKRLNIQVELAELPGIGLLDILEGVGTAILVDAVHSGAKPGTIHILFSDQLSAFQDGAGSAHGWGVAETIALGQKLMPATMPKKLIVVGIEAEKLSPGTSLSRGVKLALVEAARLIEQLVTNEEHPGQDLPSSPRISPR
jgi:hydrogenase maturation protease